MRALCLRVWDEPDERLAMDVLHEIKRQAQELTLLRTDRTKEQVNAVFDIWM